MSASIVGTLFNILVIGGVWAVLAVVVVKLNAYANTMGASQDAMNTIFFLEIAFISAPALILVAYTLNAWITAKSEASQGV
jgi:hypothetical protein